MKGEDRLRIEETLRTEDLLSQAKETVDRVSSMSLWKHWYKVVTQQKKLLSSKLLRFQVPWVRSYSERRGVSDSVVGPEGKWE